MMPAALPPMVLHEDEHLLVVNKPPGWNTHAPAEYAGEGVYDWLRGHERRWAQLAIIHRLDKDTSGVLVFAKSDLANRSLTEQFTQRKVAKEYVLITDRSPRPTPFIAKSEILRQGDRYASVPPGRGGQPAETHFIPGVRTDKGLLVVAKPVTGRTHQIRVHAAQHGFPVLGDTLYGGAPSHRLHLHARRIELTHPETSLRVWYEAPPDFVRPPRLLRRSAIVAPQDTDAYRIAHGEADALPDWQIDRWGDHVVLSGERPLTPELLADAEAEAGLAECQPSCIWHRRLLKRPRGAATTSASPALIRGSAPSGPTHVIENGARFEIRFTEGYSLGLFLDQRDNRRRILTGYVDKEIAPWPCGTGQPQALNLFAYTCAFSVCAALAGARTTSVDLSKKYLDWGKANFVANGLDPAAHEFLHGDVFGWLKRMGRRGRSFDLLIMDPPTFSTSKESGEWHAERDFPKLLETALPLLKPGGTLFASCNAAKWDEAAFVESVHEAIVSAKRNVEHARYVPQPPDFPITPEHPGHLKAIWAVVD